MSRRIPFTDLHVTELELRRELDNAFARVLDSGWFLLGDELAAFEADYAAATGARHCAGVGSGLDALVLALRALGVGPGDEVVVPSNTYVATWLAVSAVGATIVPAEPDDATCNVSPDAVADVLTERTKVVLPVHLYGGPADMERLVPLAHAHGAKVVVDAAQAHGARLGGRDLGAVGDVVAWSFYPTKNLGAFADAGAVTTDDPTIDDAIRVLRNYGSRSRYVNEVLGINSRLDELQAAVLRAKLAYLPSWIARRQEQAERYRLGFAGLPVRVQASLPAADHAYHLFVVRVPERDRFRAFLDQQGVDTIVHYPVAPHLQLAFSHLGFARGQFPLAEAIHDEIVSLPIGPHLDDVQVDAVVDATRAFYGA